VSDTVRLIVAEASQTTGTEDRLGGATHGVISRILGRAALDVSVEQFAAQLETVVSAVQAIAARLKAGVAEYSAEEITIGIAISGDGNIGVATAGVEASIQVTLKRRE
jgi:hypothetical protein